MTFSGFAILQTVATLALAAAAEQFAAHNYWIALACAVVGGGLYVAYELIPQK